jgi:hypothetical protein
VEKGKNIDRQEIEQLLQTKLEEIQAALVPVYQQMVIDEIQRHIDEAGLGVSAVKVQIGYPDTIIDPDMRFCIQIYIPGIGLVWICPFGSDPE